MALIVNTNIKNALDGYLADAKNIKGTLVIVEDDTERLKLPKKVINDGQFVYVKSTKKFYSYNSEVLWSEGLPGLQNAISEENLLNAKYIDFTDSGYEPVTKEEKTLWSSKQDALPEGGANKLLFKGNDSNLLWKSVSEVIDIDKSEVNSLTSVGTSSKFSQGSDVFIAPEMGMKVSEQDKENLVFSWKQGSFKQGEDLFTPGELPTFESKELISNIKDVE